jgi:predicted RNA binding protein YcfA (HicA-like mRNA interferase family)
VTKLPSLTGQELLKALNNAGFQKERQKGSHVFLKHPDGRATVVPIHKGESIGRGLLGKILNETELADEDLRKLL